MRNLESIIQDFGISNEVGIHHRRPFLNLKNSAGRFKSHEQPHLV